MEREGSFDHNLSSRVRKGAWSHDEDLLLTHYIQKHGEGNWYLIPKRAGLNRCRKSCRLRWLNYLSPRIKRGSFANDEIDLIIRLHKLLGNRWSLIAGRIPGRTANDVKNFWNIHLRKSQKLNNSDKKDDILIEFDTLNKVKVIKPRVRTFSRNIFFLKEIYDRIESQDRIIGDPLDKTNEILHTIPSNTIQPEYEQVTESFLQPLKFPSCEMDVNISRKGLEHGDDYWLQYLSTFKEFVPNQTSKFDVTVSLEEETLPQINTGIDWSDLLLENVDIRNLLED